MRIEIDITSHLKDLVHPNNIQCFSLTSLDAALLRLYASGQAKAIVIYRNKVFKLRINPLNQQHLVVFDTELPVYLKAGERLVIILPGHEEKRYVLQAAVEAIFMDRFRLQILDPRFTPRHQPAQMIKVQLWRVPPVILGRLENKTLHLVREAAGISVPEPEQEYVIPEPPPQAQRPDSMPQLTDYLYEKERQEVAAEFKNMKARAPFSGRLLDISCGGLCVGIELADGAKLVHQLIYVSLQLSLEKKGEEQKGAEADLHLSTFTIVRGWSGGAAPKGKLHLMHLSGLPESASPYFPGGQATP